MVNIFSFIGHTISVAVIQLCHCSTKAAADNARKNECGWVPINFTEIEFHIIFMSPINFVLLDSFSLQPFKNVKNKSQNVQNNKWPAAFGPQIIFASS